MNCTIGIDIGKDTLVIYRLPDKATLEVSNDKAGLTTLLRWLSRDEALRVVFELTGPYHRLLEKTLAAANIAMIKVNPRQARRFPIWDLPRDQHLTGAHSAISKLAMGTCFGLTV